MLSRLPAVARLGALFLVLAFALVASTGLRSGDGQASAEPASPQNPGRTAPELPGAAGPEVIERRTRTSRTYRTAQDDFQTISSLGSVNYRDPAGAWQAIDNSLVPRAGGEGFENRANRYRLGLPGDAASPVRVTEDGAFVEFALVGARGRPVARGDRVVYADALPSTDLAYEAGSDVVKETLTLSGPSAPRRSPTRSPRAPACASSPAATARSRSSTAQGGSPSASRRPS